MNVELPRALNDNYGANQFNFLPIYFRSDFVRQTTSNVCVQLWRAGIAPYRKEKANIGPFPLFNLLSKRYDWAGDGNKKKLELSLQNCLCQGAFQGFYLRRVCRFNFAAPGDFMKTKNISMNETQKKMEILLKLQLQVLVKSPQCQRWTWNPSKQSLGKSEKLL